MLNNNQKGSKKNKEDILFHMYLVWKFKRIRLDFGWYLFLDLNSLFLVERIE